MMEFDDGSVLYCFRMIELLDGKTHKLLTSWKSIHSMKAMHKLRMVLSKKIMKFQIFLIDTIVYWNVFDDWTVRYRVFRSHGADGGEDVMVAATASVRGCGEDGRTERGGLRASGRADFHAEDIGVNLHEERIFEGDAAACDDVVDRNAVFSEIVDDFSGSEGTCFDERAIDVFRPRGKRHADDESRQPRVVEA